ncbi:hypothetical protein GA0061081_102235 [Gilliamella bombicola]|uniref:Uncharacterized protein n=1 Tax=Gilliamella bombicola TaxID=1798182 RepID=A0A1C4A533_9GAMM|nr:hypothetical protein [Gilliamella bombicola]SCB89520.1 hypothetical protein GA0061081_102235 [Gilliamella bombicola]
MKIEYFEYAVATITAITAIIVAIKKVFLFFIEATPSNIKLKKYLTYKEKYSKFYSDKINNHIDGEIKKLSLAKLTKIQNVEQQNIYFNILCEHKEKVNSFLLRKLIQSSYIHNNSIKIFRNDLKEFYKRANRSYHIGWFIGLLAYFFGTIIIVSALYYRYTISDISLFKISSLYIPCFLFYSIFWALMCIHYKPINKNDLINCLKLINKD